MFLYIFNHYIKNNCKLPKFSSEFLSKLFNSRGTGICIYNNDGILLLSFLNTKLISEEGGDFGSSSKLF